MYTTADSISSLNWLNRVGLFLNQNNNFLIMSYTLKFPMNLTEKCRTGKKLLKLFFIIFE